MKGSVLNIYVPNRDKPLIDKLDRLAEERRVSRASLIITAVESYINQKMNSTTETQELETRYRELETQELETQDAALKQMLGL